MCRRSFNIRPHLQTHEIHSIGKILTLCSPALIVGGAVRNALLNTDIKDIDIATGLSPELVSQVCTSAGMKVIDTGIKHGTVTVISEGRAYEITTLRRDVETYGRRAKVEFMCSRQKVSQCLNIFKEDAGRRDLTINAMYADLEGNLFDFFDGFQDLQNTLVRFVGEPMKRIEEDYLRILRFFRFSCYYARNYDSESLRACVHLAHGLTNISPERWTMEILRILQHKAPWETVHAMSDVLKKINIHTPQYETTNRLQKTERKFDIHSTYIAKLSLFSGIQHLKLSSKEQKQINLLQDIDNLSYEATIQWLIKSIDQNNFWDGILLGNPNMSKQEIELLVSRGQNFPIKAQDLIDIGMERGPGIGKALHAMRIKFIKTGYDKNMLISDLDC